jgi:hypothetical protein
MMLYQTGDGRMSQILPESAAVFEVFAFFRHLGFPSWFK